MKVRVVALLLFLLTLFMVVPQQATALAEFQFIKYSGNPVASPTESYELHGMRDPSILQDITDGSPYTDSQGRYYVYYSALDASDEYSIALMRSSDFITWEKVAQVLPAGDPGEWDDIGVAGPSAHLIGNTIYVFYSNYSAGASILSIGYATAPIATPETLTKYGGNPVLNGTGSGWDADQVYDMSLVLSGGEYWIFYSGKGSIAQIGRANSTDLNSWTKDTANNPVVSSPINLAAEGVEIFRYASTWYLLYSEEDPDARIRLYESNDLATWNQHSIVLERGDSYDAYYSGTPTIAFLSSVDIRMLYQSSAAFGQEFTMSLAYSAYHQGPFQGIIYSRPIGTPFVADTSLAASWDMETLDGGLVDDFVNDNDGTIIGAVDRGGAFGRARGFDGTDDQISVDGLLTQLATDTSGTIASWMYLNEDDSRQNSLFSISRDGTPNTYLIIVADLRSANNWFTLEVGVDGVVQWRAHTEAGSTDIAQWFHIALVHNGTEPSVYLNGVAQSLTYVTDVDRTDWAKSVITDASSPADTADFGVLQLAGSDYNFLNGGIDDSFISSRAYSATEIALTSTRRAYELRFNTTTPSDLTAGSTWVRGDGQAMGAAVNASSTAFTINITTWATDYIAWDSYATGTITTRYNFTLAASTSYPYFVDGVQEGTFTTDASGEGSFDWTSWTVHQFEIGPLGGGQGGPGAPRIILTTGFALYGWYGNTVLLNASAYSEPDRNLYYRWHMGDGTVRDTAVVEHSYPIPLFWAKYNVKLEVCTPGEAICETRTIPVVLINWPVIFFTVAAFTALTILLGRRHIKYRILKKVVR